MLEEGNAKSSSTEPGSRAKTRMAALISYMSLPTKRAGNGGEAHNEHICSLELCSQEKYTSIVTRNPEYSSNKLWLIFPVFSFF
jgi:hypothetical protein